MRLKELEASIEFGSLENIRKPGLSAYTTQGDQNVTIVAGL